MSTASDRLRKQAKKVAKEIHKMNGTVKGAAREKLREVRKTGSKGYENGLGKVHQMERNVVRMIREQPLRSAFIAAGIGAVIGGFWFRHLIAVRTHTKNDA